MVFRISLKTKAFLKKYRSFKISDSSIFKNFNGEDPNPVHRFPVCLIFVFSVSKFFNYWTYKSWGSSRRASLPLPLQIWPLLSPPAHSQRMTYFIKIKVFKYDLFLLCPNTKFRFVLIYPRSFFLRGRSDYGLDFLCPIGPSVPLICSRAGHTFNGIPCPRPHISNLSLPPPLLTETTQTISLFKKYLHLIMLSHICPFVV